jgi:acetolactate decarboxylase
MINRITAIGFMVLIIFSCNKKKEANVTNSYNDVKIIGAMKNVMWKGKLGGSIHLDTITNKVGLYGLGPESYLTGELLIIDGKSYVSRVTSDSTLIVEESFEVSAPFFVYANVTEWDEIVLPKEVKTIKDLEKFIDQRTKEYKRPFTFKLDGEISHVVIHAQNLPKGTQVSSPEEAHQGQTNYELQNEDTDIIGFFSTDHKGVFTHHDSFLHMHLITKDKSMMGHLDSLEIANMKLYLPKK